MNPYSNQAAAAYRQAAASVHPTVAVVKLYDATLLAIRQAIMAREAGRPEECFIKVMRAATILRGLDHALDFAKGGAVAERLHRVYQSYILALHLSFGKPDVVARYTKLHDSLVELRQAWASIAGMSDTSDERGAAADPLAAPAVPGVAEPRPSASLRPAPPTFDANAFIGLMAPEAAPAAGRARTRPVRPERPRTRPIGGGRPGRPAPGAPSA